MSLKKKIICVLSAAAIMLSVSGCGAKGETKFIATYNEEEIPAGVYLYSISTSLSNAYSKMSDEDKEAKKDVLDITIDDISASEWVVNDAKLSLAKYLVVEDMFKEMGLNVTNADKESVDNSIEQIKSYYPTFFESVEKIGVSMETYKNMQLNSIKLGKVFKQYYSAEGVSPVTEDEYKAYFEENFRRINTLIVSMADAEGKPFEEADLITVRENADKYLERLNNGEEFAKVLFDYDKFTAKAEADAEEIKEDDMRLKSMLVRTNNDKLPEDFFTTLDAAEDGKYVRTEKDSKIYITKKADLYENAEEYENTKPTMLGEMKAEEFEKMIEDKANEISANINYNAAALEKYTVADVEKRSK